MGEKEAGLPKTNESDVLRDAVLAQRRARADRLRDEAWSKARSVAELLRSRYGAKRVLVYGSLAQNQFRDGSDIDVFVEGFMGSYWRMLGEAERLSAPFEISIVCAEDALPALVEAVLREGVEV